MNWKKYKSLPEKEKKEETYYIIGLDIGNDSSGIAFYNIAGAEPEIIDLSGGYGRPTIPTAMQYIVESKEWVFGEYAILNRGMGKEITLTNLIERLGSSEYIDIDNKPVSVINLLGMYIKELLSNVKNINPKAEIAGIVTSIPSYFSSQAREELTRAFKSAGYEKELIGLITDRECIFAYHYSKMTENMTGNMTGNKDKLKAKQNILLLDYGAREVRGGVYVNEGNVNEGQKSQEGQISQISQINQKSQALKSLSSLFEDSIGTKMIEDQVKKLFTNYYMTNNPVQAHQGLDRSLSEQIMAFTYQHKDILFQKAIRGKPAKLYFNFAFPPFQQTVSGSDAENLIEPFRKRFNQFIRQILEKSITKEGEKVTATDIDVVICIGGGFEMLWAKEAAGSLFHQGKLQFYKNSKAVTAMGAAVAAAGLLGALVQPETLALADFDPPEIEDRHQLSVDIGLKLKDERFIPLAECNSFWWQPHPPRLFIVNAPVDGEIPLSILARSPEGETNILSDTILTGMPARPKGTTRLSMQLKFLSDSEATVMVKDSGFGEIFPASGYEREISLKI